MNDSDAPVLLRLLYDTEQFGRRTRFCPCGISQVVDVEGRHARRAATYSGYGHR